MTRQEIDTQTENNPNEEEEAVKAECAAHSDLLKGKNIMDTGTSAGKKDWQGKIEDAASTPWIYRIPAGMKFLDTEFLSSHPQAQKAKKIILPDSLKIIGNYCFSGFHELEEAVFPASVLKMGKGVFQHCWHLKKAVLPSGTEYLDDQFFYGCGNLKKLLIPASVGEISRDALRSCSRLKTVTVSDEKFPDYPRRVKQLSVFTLMENADGRSWKTLSSAYPNAAVYMIKRSRGLMDIAIAGNHPEAASFLLQNMDYSGEDLQDFSGRANEEGRTEIMALLLREIGRRDDGRADDGEEEMFSW